MREDLTAIRDRLVAQFPEVSRDTVESIVERADRTVRDASGTTSADRTEQLARLRLEIQLGRPAGPIAS